MVSPHLDDAVFSCGRLLASQGPAVVVTVFAGSPDEDLHTAWDVASGFADGREAIAARRAEDRAALRVLGAACLWLDFLDSQYAQARPAAEEVADRLQEIVREFKPRSLFIPMGLFHSDHQLTRHAGLTLWQRESALHGYVYEDALYRRIPRLRASAVRQLRGEGWGLRRVRFAEHGSARCRKRDAVGRYRSQLKALGTPGRLGTGDTESAEGYWRLEPDRAVTPAHLEFIRS